MGMGTENIPDVLANLLYVSHACFGSRDAVIRSVPLIGSNEIRIVDTGKWLHLLHLLADETLQSRLQDLSTVHGFREVHGTNVPSTDDEIVRMDHWQNIMEGDVDLFARVGFRSELHGRRHDDRTIVVGRLRALTRVPDEATTVRNDSCGDSGSVVSCSCLALDLFHGPFYSSDEPPQPTSIMPTFPTFRSTLKS